MRRFGCKISFVIACALWTSAACALDPELPKGCGPLPDVTKESKSGVLITAERIGEYRQILPPEVAHLVEQGELQFEAVLRARGLESVVSGASGSSASYTLGTAGELRSVPEGGLGARPFALPASVEGDPKTFAYKVLWNSAGVLAEERSFSMLFSALIFQRADAEPHVLEFLNERIYPLALGLPSGTQKPFFREKIAAIKPEVIRNVSWLTLRFFGPFEDYVWAASPVINKIRQMTGSNRSDAMFSQAFSPDDLFVWSGKIEMVDPVGITSQPLLVPILQAQGAKTDTKGDCVTNAFREGASVTVNSETRRFKGAASWVPSNVVMALRTTWKIDLTSKDPFSNDSRQSVYFDVETGLPVYRVVWDQSGRLQRVIGGIVRPVPAAAGRASAAWAGEWIVHTNGTTRVDLVAREFTVCRTAGPGRSLEEFDPSSFIKFEAKEISTAGKEKNLEQRGESDDISD